MKSSSSSAQAARPSAVSRVIPREQLQGVAAWRPGSFDLGAADADLEEALPEPVPSQAEWLERLHQAQQAAHQEGYHNGYRDGLVALENFKQSLALQATQQMDQLLDRLEDEIDALQPMLAQSVCELATELAAQVLRQALRTQPEAVAVVATEAIHSVVQSARRITVHLHPEDLEWVRKGAADALESRSARLQADSSLRRGDCLVRSEFGTVDARVATRWAQATSFLDAGTLDELAPEALATQPAAEGPP